MSDEITEEMQYSNPGTTLDWYGLIHKHYNSHYKM